MIGQDLEVKLPNAKYIGFLYSDISRRLISWNFSGKTDIVYNNVKRVKLLTHHPQVQVPLELQPNTETEIKVRTTEFSSCFHYKDKNKF